MQIDEDLNCDVKQPRPRSVVKRKVKSSKGKAHLVRNHTGSEQGALRILMHEDSSRPPPKTPTQEKTIRYEAMPVVV
jgi:hypothetical protein